VGIIILRHNDVLRKFYDWYLKFLFVKDFSLLSFSFSFAKEKGKKVTKESKKKDRGRFLAARFQGMKTMLGEHFYKNTHPRSYFRGVGCRTMLVRTFLRYYTRLSEDSVFSKGIVSTLSKKKLRCVIQ